MSNFKLIASGIDPQPVLDALDRLPELWDEVTIRQNYEGSAHKDTKCIFLRAPTSLENILEVIDTVATHNVGRLGSPVMELMNHLCGLVGIRELGRVMLVKLKPCGIISAHRDEGAYARYYSRFHFVLSGSCKFYCGGISDKPVAPAVGELWWFDHQKTHQVFNNGEDRIHLIFDGTAPGYTGALHQYVPGPF